MKHARGLIAEPLPPAPLPEAGRGEEGSCSPSPLRGGGRGEGLRSSLLLLALMAARCGGIAVRRALAPGLFDAWLAIAVADDLSPRTLQTLRSWNLEQAYRGNPAEALGLLQAAAEKDPQPDLLFALAEISYLLGKRT